MCVCVCVSERVCVCVCVANLFPIMYLMIDVSTLKLTFLLTYRIHLETSSVLIRQLPIEYVKKPQKWKYAPFSMG